MHFKNLLIILLLSTSLPSFAKPLSGDSSIVQRKSVIKLNLFSLPFKVASLQYEYRIRPKMTLALTAGYGVKRNFLKSLEENTGGIISAPTATSLYISPEWRNYFGKKTKAPRGFYLSLFARYRYAQIGTTVAVLDSAGRKYELPLKLTSNAIGLGIMPGYQWIINDRISIDYWIIGPFFGYQWNKLNIDLSGVSYFLDDPGVKKQIDKAFEKADVPYWAQRMIRNYITSQEVNVNWGQPFVGLRTGLTFGIKF